MCVILGSSQLGTWLCCVDLASIKLIAIVNVRSIKTHKDKLNSQQNL
jgi:hypothetical protein